ncbi:Tyrosine-protein kinase CSK [Fragariocoptes setiger]|uniref:Tyrosine-protein kinase n=1 Tax=Fragariocoptes setiger TaxID=1670756 RepID=A0ABQ7SBN1_9ACAR|nr:Tyrosine-protein kinase CSK [Fragariocoptes setiger]
MEYNNRLPFMFGKITREEAEDYLKNGQDGLYLVRSSTNFPGDYTLCVCCNNKVEHYRIIFMNNKYTIDEEGFFDSLSQLVEHYKQDADGLCTALRQTVPKKCDKDGLKAFEAAGWVIRTKDLEFKDEILGKGETGDVELAVFRNQKVAVKKMKDSCAAISSFLTEASLMTSLRHKNLVQLLGITIDKPTICLVTEFMANGSLVEYLQTRGSNKVSKLDQIKFATDTCAGMAYLESKEVVHRDLAARNVLISDDFTAKVCDFGLASRKDITLDCTGGRKVPIKWTAPESLRLGEFSSKSDMWSFGILLFEIYSFGRTPYPRIPLADVVKYVEEGYRMEAPNGCPPEIYAIMRRAWHAEPKERPTFHEVLIQLEQIKDATPETE